MSQRHYKPGQDRQQGMLLPYRVEDYVSEDNPVRAIEVYVESLDLAALGFQHATGPLTAGQPAFAPGGLLKLYLYGFLHGVRSSRKLAQECQRNLEVMWLLEGLQPSYKTIADFRKDNLNALKAANRDFVQLCQELELFGKELLAIDGSYFQGNVGKKNIYTQERLEKSLRHLEQLIASHLAAMEQADGEEGTQEDPSVPLAKKLEQLKTRQKKNQERLARLQASGETQLAEVDADARLLSKPGQAVAGYNVQTVVDEKHKLLVSCVATQAGNDTQQLAPMAKQAQQVLGVSHCEVVSDAGYYNFGQIQECLEAGITPYVAEPDKQGRTRKQGKFLRTDFTYVAQADCYRCPAGATLVHSSQGVQKGKLRQAYRSQPARCAACGLKAHCLPAKTRYRSIYRWEHEEIITAHRQRMAAQGAVKMAQRACLSEHPFGTLKTRCGWQHFLLRGLAKVSAELALWMLGYNFQRVLNIVGMEKWQAVCREKMEQRRQARSLTPFLAVFRAAWGLAVSA